MIRQLFISFTILFLLTACQHKNTNRITELVNKMLELSDAGSQVTIERLDETSALEIAAQAAADSGIAIAHLVFLALSVILC